MHRWIALPLAALAMPAMALVNVNTAQQSELERTKGLDRTKAKSLIEYRAQTGVVFTSVDELQKVPGFDARTIAQVAPQVAFQGPAYTPPPKPAAPAKKK